jgi:hypothetical protein
MLLTVSFMTLMGCIMTLSTSLMTITQVVMTLTVPLMTLIKPPMTIEKAILRLNPSKTVTLTTLKRRVQPVKPLGIFN